jgi:hypothetical protein
MESTESKEKDVVKRNYGRIVLTLENAILPHEKLESKTVSQEDGLLSEIELDLRILGCELIQTAGILLKLPQVRSEKRSETIKVEFSEILRAPYCESSPHISFDECA